MADNSLVKNGFTVSPKTGTGNATLTITGSERTGRVDADAVAFTATLDKFPSVSKSFKVIQKGKPEFVTLDVTAVSVDKKGEVVNITGTSNSSKLSFSCAADEVTFNSYTANGASAVNGAAIAGDPGASAQFAFSIPVTVSVNTTASSKRYELDVITSGGQTATVLLTQIASDFTYSLDLTASPTLIQANGGSSTITGKYKTFRNGVLINTEDVTPTCSIPEGTAFTLEGNKVSAPNRGTTVGEERSVTVSASYGNASSTITVSQEKNEITNYGDVHANIGGFYPVGGDPMTDFSSDYTFDPKPTVGCIFFLDTTQNITYTSGSIREGEITRAKTVVTPCDGFSVDLDSRPTEILISADENKSESKIGPLVVKITDTGEGGKSLSTTGSVYQTAGVKTYAIPDIAIASYDDIPASGGSITPTITYSQTWGWNGSTTEGGILTSGGTVTFDNGTTDGTVSAESLGTTFKDRSLIKTVTATATMNGKSASKSYTIYQAVNKVVAVKAHRSDDISSDIHVYYSSVSISAAGGTNLPIAVGQLTVIFSSGSTANTGNIGEFLGGTTTFSRVYSGTATGFTVDETTGVVTASNRGTIIGGARSVDVTSELTATFTNPSSVGGSTVTDTISCVNTVTQSANQVESSTTSGGETIYNPVTAGAISNKTIPASGGSAIATAGEGSQSWTTNKKYRHDTYSSGDKADVLVEDSKIGSDAIAPSVASISGSAESKGTIVSDVTIVKSQAVTWTGSGGKKATGTMYIYQEANAETGITYGKPVISSFTVDDIPASGGSISSGSVRYGQSRTQHYTSGDTSQLAQVDSGGTITYSTAVSAGTLGTTVKARTAIDTLTVTVAMNGQSNSKDATVYQAANSATYGAVSVSATTPVPIPAIGAIYNIKPTASQTVSFTSGDTRDGSISFSYAAKNTVTGFSNNGETVTVQQNLSTSPRNGFIVTVTAAGEGSKSASTDVTFNQAAAAAYLTVDPTTISFAADGSSTTFTIESNDSWTIS